jgi:hypothetical protein
MLSEILIYIGKGLNICLIKREVRENLTLSRNCNSEPLTNTTVSSKWEGVSSNDDKPGDLPFQVQTNNLRG